MPLIRDLVQTSKERLKHGPNRQIVVATDVPFWQRRTGAQLRISELVSVLGSHSFDVSICFLGSLKAEADSSPSLRERGNETLTDLELISRQELKVISLYDDWEPTSFGEQLARQAKCITNEIGKRLRNLTSVNRNESSDDPIKPKHLSDFFSSTLEHRFRWLIRELSPRIVIVEYISLSYLVPERASRKGVSWWIDTHDVLASRAKQFAEHGFQHWLEITPEEEIEAINRFDGVIAIQPAEQQYFQSIVKHGQPVFTAGFSGSSLCSKSRAHSCDASSEADTACSVGMLASNNSANFYSVDWFLREVWPLVLQSKEPEAKRTELVIAGSVGRALEERLLPDRCRLLGHVESVDDFYSAIDLIVNPIKFGTGLKIKTIEALRYERPLIATTHAVEGVRHSFESWDQLPWLVADSAKKMAEAIIRIANVNEERKRLKENAAAFVRSQLTMEEVYRDLLQGFEENLA